jgi:hypothetical protein
VGVEIERERFTAHDFAMFRERLRDGLVALEQVLARPGFGEGARTIGAELEMFTVDTAGRPLAAGEEVVRRIADPHVSHELGVFNVELNTEPVALAGRPFGGLRADMVRRRRAHDRSGGRRAGGRRQLADVPGA